MLNTSILRSSLLRCMLTALLLVLCRGVWALNVNSTGNWLTFFSETRNLTLQEARTFYGTTYDDNNNAFSVTLSLPTQSQLRPATIRIAEGQIGELTIKAPSNYVLTNITFDYDGSYFPLTVTSKSGGTVTNGYRWDGNASSVTLDIESPANDMARIKGITFTYEKSANSAPDAPILMPPAGNYTVAQTVYITNNNQSGVTFYFCKSENGKAYEDYGTSADDHTWYQYDPEEGGINVDKNMMLSVAAVNSYGTVYTHAQYTITPNQKATTPTISPTTGEFNVAQTVTITSPDNGVTIFYCTREDENSSQDPNDGSWNWQIYTQPFTIAESRYVYAYANGDDYDASDIAVSHITITTSKQGAGLKWTSNGGSDGTEYTSDNPLTVTFGSTYTLPKLYNPNNVPVTYSLWGVNADLVASIDNDGNVTIIGPGTVSIAATYIGSDTYNAQVAVYTLNVNQSTSGKTMTFWSGGVFTDKGTVDFSKNQGTFLAQNVQPYTVNSAIQSADVPDGVVVNLSVTGATMSNLVMCSLSTDPTFTDDGYPQYDINKNGDIRGTETFDAYGHVATSNFQYLGRGIPVYYSDTNDGTVYLKARIYNQGDTKNVVAQFVIQLNVKSTSSSDRPDAPTADPATQGVAGEKHTVLTLSESATVNGESAATVYAKYSNSQTYTPRTLLGEESVSIGTGKTGVYSTVLQRDRRTTAIQVRHNQSWKGNYYDVASDAMSAFYTYIPNRKAVRLEAVNNPIRRDLTKDKDNLSASLQINAYIDEKLQTVTDGKSVLPSGLNYSYVSSDPTVATVDANGNVTMVGAGSATITVTTPKVDGGLIQGNNNTYKADPDHPGYEAAATAFNIYVTDVENKTLLAPTFSPATDREYYAPFKATVVANLQDEDDDALTVGKAYYVVVDDQNDNNIDFTNPDNIINPDASVVVSSGIVNVNGTKTVDIPTKYKTGSDMADGDTYTIYAVTYNPDKDSNQKSSVASVTFTFRKITVDAPVLVPGTSSELGREENFYTFYGDSLIVTATSTTAGAQVYFTLNSASNEVFVSNGQLYSGDTKIRLGGSTVVRAVAYYNGVYSDVVTYTYRKGTPNIGTPTFLSSTGNKPETVSDNNYKGEATGSVTIYLHCDADVDNNGVNVDITKDNKYYDNYIIYYTTDGTWPTSRSQVYDPAKGLTFNYSVVIRAFCKNTAVGATGLSSQLTLTVNGGVEVWQANSTTCPGDVLSANVISQNVDNANKSTAPHYITITLGQDGQKWGKNDVIEGYKGNRVDNYGTLDIIALSTDGITGGNKTDADDELGVLYDHSYAQLNDYSSKYTGSTTPASQAKHVYESTFKLPSHGTFVKFEPQRDGEVFIWCEQNGGMHFSNGANSRDRFYNQFIRKRPAYFVDEEGKSIPADNIFAAGTLNNRWSEIDRSTLLGMNGIEDGLPQNLFTLEEAQGIYDMYADAIEKAKGSRNINDLIVKLNDGNHQTAASAGVDINGTDAVIDGTGYCIPSASYMRYEFPVRAGKTYFFFAVKTKIGISALGFKASESDDDANSRQTVTIDGNIGSTTDNAAAISSAITSGKTVNVTVTRSFTANTWAALVLPFSMSATQVQETFGEGTLIQHYYGFQEAQPISFINLAQHDHQMIVAGTPVFICPTKDVKGFTVNGVQIEKTAVEAVADQQWGSNVSMTGTYDYNASGIQPYDFYVQGGNLVQASAAKAINASRAWLTGLSNAVYAKVGYRRGTTTGITTVYADALPHSTDDTVYSVSGVAVGRGEDGLRSLPQGVYIYHGRKFVKAK